MKDKEYSEGDLIEVRWADCEDDSAWTPLEVAKISKVPRCKSVGWFIKEDDDNICLAFSVSEDMDVAKTNIPTGMIKSVKKIEDSELDDF